MIDILVPVLGRPQNAQPLVDSIRATTSVEHEIHFLCSHGDEQQIAASFVIDYSTVHIMLFPAGRHDYPRKINAGYRETIAPWLLLAADDLDFQPGWDTEALRVAEETGAGVIGTNDCANPSVKKGLFSTHPLVRRTYIDEQGGSLDGPGVLLHEGYDHNMTDVELCELAQARQQWAFAADARICHRHPGFGTAPQDATYLKGRRFLARDRQTFKARQQQWAPTTGRRGRRR